MPFPESPRVVYKSNPLLQVICQLKFPTILEINTTGAAAFQREIRKEYPHYSGAERVVPESAMGLLKQLSIVPPAAATEHRFKTEDGTRELVLTSAFLAISTTSYARWEPFLAAIVKAQTALEAACEPSFYSRVGLRYINLIYRRDLELGNAPWSELLNPELGGMLSGNLKDSVEDASSETLIKNGDSAYIKLRSGLARTEDRKDEVGFLIDADLFTAQKEDGKNVSRTLSEFHRTAGHLFRWAIRRPLHAAFRPERPRD
jgi:uncharacterized protein (TIGR04255 family)